MSFKINFVFKTRKNKTGYILKLQCEGPLFTGRGETGFLTAAAVTEGPCICIADPGLIPSSVLPEVGIPGDLLLQWSSENGIYK